jgi:hypothetical protein
LPAKKILPIVWIFEKKYPDLKKIPCKHRMRGLNKALIGNLGKVGVAPHPEVEALEGNIRVPKFSPATSESYKDDKGV